MPELPEVETYRRYFARHALHQRVTRVEVRDERILGEIRTDAFARRLRGREFSSVRRHGKHLFAEAGGSWLHLHFGMSGDLAYYRDPKDEPRFARVVFSLDGGAKLAFEDMRLFGVADLVDSPDRFVEQRGLGPDPLDGGAKLAFEDMRLFGVADLVDSPDRFIEERGLGPDPLDPSFTATAFARLLEGRRGAIKSLLMTQEIIAGIGNLYADETLFQTGIHPRRAVDRITKVQERAIFTKMRKVLDDSISRHERGASVPPKWLMSNREEGERCPRCGGTIRRATVFGRTTYFCGSHQKV